MNSVRDRANCESELERYRELQKKTTDPLAARLLAEIVYEMGADLARNDDGENPL